MTNNRYKLNDKFVAKGCNDYGILKIVDVVHENYDDITYTLESLKYGQKYHISDTAIDQFYKKIPTIKSSQIEISFDQFKDYLG
jgi:hypothetical protein